MTSSNVKAAARTPGVLCFDGGHVEFDRDGSAEFTFYESYVLVEPLEEKHGCVYRATIDKTEVADVVRFLSSIKAAPAVAEPLCQKCGLRSDGSTEDRHKLGVPWTECAAEDCPSKVTPATPGEPDAMWDAKCEEIAKRHAEVAEAIRLHESTWEHPVNERLFKDRAILLNKLRTRGSKT